MYDLVLKGGTVIDPAQGLNGVMDVAIAAGKIAAVAADIPASESARVVGVAGKIVTPGLIDFHAHVYPGGVGNGINPDEHMLKRGVTTVMDGGSAGSDNFGGLKKFIIDASRIRVYALVNLSCLGLAGNRLVGELMNPGYADPEGAAAVLRSYPDVALGLKVRLSENVVGGPCLPMMKVARQVADEVKVPVMIHIGNTVETLPQILELMKAGDVVSHFLTARRNGCLDSEGRIFPAVREARERGVLFDVARGRSHVSFQVADRMLDQGFPPDVITTDLSGRQLLLGALCDMPVMMTQFLMLGIPMAEVIRLSTNHPAELLGKADQFGSLRPGLEADVAVLELEDGEFPMHDATGETRLARRRFVPRLTVKAGRLV